ncbi:MAG: hypothetical protein ACRC7J_02035 [Vibrio ordalii]|jgi:hypothetical protein|uniref:hypothetical protein n=1 Tax=Vibrio ordalii TaxID=28174 RepID=UPI003F2BCADE
MSISGVHSGYQLINQSNKMVEEAASELNMEKDISPVDKADKALAFNKVELDKVVAKAEDKPEAIDSLLKLNQATQYNRIGTNIIQRDQDMLGSILDIQA